MSDLRLEQIVVGRWRDGDFWLYGLDEYGNVWSCEPNGPWHKMPMKKAEGEE